MKKVIKLLNFQLEQEIDANFAEDHELICVFLKCVGFAFVKMRCRVFCLGLKRLAGKSGNLIMSRDMIGDFLTIIRNGLKVNKRSVVLPSSILKVEIAKVLKDEGYIKDFKLSEEDKKKTLTILLKYVDGESVIHEITSVSTPGRRQYENSKSITPVIGGLGISILTTSSGVITDRQAKKLGVGGEVICHVW